LARRRGLRAAGGRLNRQSTRRARPAREEQQMASALRRPSSQVAARPRAALEVADIFGRTARLPAAHSLPLTQLKVMRAIETCRSATLGGHIEQRNNVHCS